MVSFTLRHLPSAERRSGDLRQEIRRVRLVFRENCRDPVETMAESIGQDLADIARKRHQARQPVGQERGGVNALLGKLRYVVRRQGIVC